MGRKNLLQHLYYLTGYCSIASSAWIASPSYRRSIKKRALWCFYCVHCTTAIQSGSYACHKQIFRKEWLQCLRKRCILRSNSKKIRHPPILRLHTVSIHSHTISIHSNLGDSYRQGRRHLERAAQVTGCVPLSSWPL